MHILDSFPVSKKISIYKEISSYKTMCEVFWYPRCLDNICLTENTKFDYNISKRLDLSYEDIHFNKFKINEHRKGRYPKL